MLCVVAVGFVSSNNPTDTKTHNQIYRPRLFLLATGAVISIYYLETMARKEYTKAPEPPGRQLIGISDLA